MAGNPREMIIQPVPDEKSQLTTKDITVQHWGICVFLFSSNDVSYQ
jgi:hypothetical protein